MVPGNRPAVIGSEAPRYHARALLRGLDILGAFSIEEPELTLTAISDRIHLHPATALRLLDCLRFAGFVEQDAERQRWRLGVRAFEVGSVYLATQTIERLARPFLEGLAHRLKQTANLGVRDGFSVVHLAVVQPARPLRYQTYVGARAGLHCSGLGKVLAAEMPQEDIDLLVAERMNPYTPNTMTDEAVFRAHLEEVRRTGYALDDQEAVAGLRCVAAPVRDRRGVLRAALSISGPAAEFEGESLQTYIRDVCETAAELSTRVVGV